jgi:DinB family protein
MDLVLDDVIAILTRTPRVLDVQLRGLSEGWLASNEGPDTWNPRNVVGHLIDCEELNWIPRARIILDQGPARVFEPFDRFRHLSRTMPINDLLETYAELRAANLDTLRSWRLGPKELALTGEHPEFGTVTLSQLLAAWVAHDLDHLNQVERVLAVRYREAVGPWKAYMSILKPRA